MKHLILAIGLIGCSGAIAGPMTHTEYAPVVDTNPIYITVESSYPQEICHTETVAERKAVRPNTTDTLVGGIIGGAVGHAVGSGKDNKKIGAVVGSVLGMSIASDKANRRQHNAPVVYRNIERCRTEQRVEREQVLKGYDVTYRYNGKDFTTFMKQPPGESIKLSITVNPQSY